MNSPQMADVRAKWPTIMDQFQSTPAILNKMGHFDLAWVSQLKS